MNDKPPLRPPKEPPTFTKKTLDPNNCVLHQGPLDENVYICEKCGAKMCYSCALNRKNVQKKPYCPICTAYLFVKE